MNTQGTVAVNASRKAVYDKVESQIHTCEAQLATLKAKLNRPRQTPSSGQSATCEGETKLDQKVPTEKAVEPVQQASASNSFRISIGSPNQ